MDSCQALKQRGNLKVCPSNTFLVRQSVVEEKFIVSKVDDRKKMSHYLVPTSSEAGDPMEDVRRLIAANNFGHPHLYHEASKDH